MSHYPSLHLDDEEDQGEVIPICEAALEVGSYQYTPLLRSWLAELYLYRRQYRDALKLAEETLRVNSDSNFVGYAWAHKTEALASLMKENREAADAALTQLERTDFPNTQALILSVVLEFGSPEQKERALPFVADVPRTPLLPYYRERLCRALNQAHSAS